MPTQGGLKEYQAPFPVLTNSQIPYPPVTRILLQDNLQITQEKHIDLQQISGQRQTIPSGIHPPTEPFYNECLPKIVLTIKGTQVKQFRHQTANVYP